MANTQPKHQMAYFPSLMSQVRASGLFRQVMHTSLYCQLVSMEIPINGDIGEEVHTVDQVYLFTRGEGLATVAGKNQKFKASDIVIVPAGTQHQFLNTSKTVPLELITIYAPAEHHPQTVHKTKEEGEQEEADGKDKPADWSQLSKTENEKRGFVKETGGPYEE